MIAYAYDAELERLKEERENQVFEQSEDDDCEEECDPILDDLFAEDFFGLKNNINFFKTAKALDCLVKCVNPYGRK